MRILVISHDASRSGAPILLLHLLRAFKKKMHDLELDIVISRSGPLIKEFREIGNRVLILNENQRFVNSPTQNIIIKLFNKTTSLLVKEKSIGNKLDKFVSNKYDLIFSNTITNGFILNALQPARCTIISYVHELENTIKGCTTPETLIYALKYSNIFIVPSVAVKRNLVNAHQVSPSKIRQLNYYIPEMQVSAFPSENTTKKEFIVGCVGTLEWRKGADLFLHVVKLFKTKNLSIKVKFMWVGVNKESSFYKEFAHDVKIAGLGDEILSIEKVENPFNYLALMDVFLMLSREDPYPLVVLEAAMLKKPIICFENAGGTSEFLSDNNGIIVPYLDIVAVVEKIRELLFDDNLRKFYGERAKSAYMLKHSEDVAMKHFTELINEFGDLGKNSKKLG